MWHSMNAWGREREQTNNQRMNEWINERDLVNSWHFKFSQNSKLNPLVSWSVRWGGGGLLYCNFNRFLPCLNAKYLGYYSSDLPRKAKWREFKIRRLLSEFDKCFVLQFQIYSTLKMNLIQKKNIPHAFILNTTFININCLIPKLKTLWTKLGLNSISCSFLIKQRSKFN